MSSDVPTINPMTFSVKHSFDHYFLHIASYHNMCIPLFHSYRCTVGEGNAHLLYSCPMHKLPTIISSVSSFPQRMWVYSTGHLVHSALVCTYVQVDLNQPMYRST